MPDELRYRPDSDDPAFKEGYQFVDRALPYNDGFDGAPWWHGWMVRQAFWCGVRWERERKKT